MTENSYNFRKIATIHTDFDEKFGIPRQGGLIEELKGEIVFEPEFRNPDVGEQLTRSGSTTR